MSVAVSADFDALFPALSAAIPEHWAEEKHGCSKRFHCYFEFSIGFRQRILELFAGGAPVLIVAHVVDLLLFMTYVFLSLFIMAQQALVRNNFFDTKEKYKISDKSL